MANHRISTFALDFTIGQKDQAWAMQKQFERLIADQVVPRLEIAFDQIDNRDTLLLIDRLDIQLGALSSEAFHREFVEQVVTKIVNELLHVSPSSRQRHLLKLPRSQAIAAAFVHFLSTGLVPEAFQALFGEASEREIFKSLEEHFSIQATLKQHIEHQATSHKRLQLQFSSEFRRQLRELINIDSSDRGFAPSDKPMGSGTSKTAEKTFIREKPFDNEAPNSPGSIPQAAALDQGDFETINSHNKAQAYQFIPNAGLVLLHPYISGDNTQEFALFEELKLTEDHQFKDTNAQYRALHVLQYLVWGKENQLEHTMLLSKILCGFPVEEPVQRFVALKQEEKKACHKVAELLSEDWRGISEMSLEALQETFLQRMGKLSPHSMGYQLKIERRTHDIILSRLPHGLSVVKFSWMKKFLWIEW
jgi:hypothetical protein